MVEMQKDVSANTSLFTKVKTGNNTDLSDNIDHENTAPNSNSTSNPDSGLITDNMNSRDAEKLETLAKQRDNYLNPSNYNTGNISNNTDNTNNNGNTTNFNNQNVFNNLGTLLRVMFTDIDPYLEHLYYLFTIELFFIFLTYTHYPSLDKRNKFLTPIIMGCETSLLGQTIIQIYRWNKFTLKFKDQKLMISMVLDEEKNIQLTDLKTFHHQRNRSGFNNNTNSNTNKTHSRAPSSIINTPTLSPTTRTQVNSIPLTSQYDTISNKLKDTFIKEHLKFLAWGGLNGLLCSYWIEFVISIFKEHRIFCVLIDQSLGTVIFQTLYSLFVCLWDGEVQIGNSSNTNHHDHYHPATLELTWDSFNNHYAGMLWKYMKLSWMVWPIVSFFSFMVLPQEWIFPVNCVFVTIFTVVLEL